MSSVVYDAQVHAIISKSIINLANGDHKEIGDPLHKASIIAKDTIELLGESSVEGLTEVLVGLNCQVFNARYSKGIESGDYLAADAEIVIKESGIDYSKVEDLVNAEGLVVLSCMAHWVQCEVGDALKGFSESLVMASLMQDKDCVDMYSKVRGDDPFVPVSDLVLLFENASEPNNDGLIGDRSTPLLSFSNRLTSPVCEYGSDKFIALAEAARSGSSDVVIDGRSVHTLNSILSSASCHDLTDKKRMSSMVIGGLYGLADLILGKKDLRVLNNEGGSVIELGRAELDFFKDVLSCGVDSLGFEKLTMDPEWRKTFNRLPRVDYMFNVDAKNEMYSLGA